jgi:Pyruvate/2-oxoglutarate dehydrogenase complex, dihydrolipoamide acyltransferase (E2) component, and related enzymes
MIYEVTMPALSSTMTEGKIVSWCKKVGDKVKIGETIAIVESDKADMDAECFYDGYVGMIVVPEGVTVPVGAVIAYVAETEAEIEQIKDHIKSSSQPAETPQPVVQQVNSAIPEVVTSRRPAPPAPAKSDRLIASPRAKRLAQENGIDLRQIKGTGPNGRITAADIENRLASNGKSNAKTVPVTPVATASTQALTGLQQAVVRNMNASLTVPTFQVGYTITTNDLDNLYKQIKAKGVTMTALLAKAVAMTLTKHPLINAVFSEQGIKYNRDINIAVAVAMDDGGLITPVLKNADQMDIYTLSRTWKSLVERARSKQLSPEEYSTGTFTISNLGMFGVDRFTAILPPNTGAILAVGASRPTVVATPEGAIAVKNQMQVNLTADHRVIYGAHAAQFLQDLAKLIEQESQSLTL